VLVAAGAIIIAAVVSCSHKTTVVRERTVREPVYVQRPAAPPVQRNAQQPAPPYAAPNEESTAPPPPPGEELPAGADVLTSGPVNEAFAQPVTLEAQAGLVAPRQPPAPIDEVPPADRPQGASYVWVPGYWAWDADRSDFIWVSACWRAAPPNMYWVAGYWAQVDNGFEWVPGFWAPVGDPEIEYLPAPPAPPDLMPPGPPPVIDNIWVPGCWYWQNGRYVQRRGYWLAARADWDWVPSHYVWTPRGYVFCEGHWDYPLERRGVLFAPVYFPRDVYVRRGFRWSPSIVVNIGALQISLFTYPRYSHYYFGDYYDDRYLRAGIFPRFEVESRHTWYDPIYERDRWTHRRTDPRWEQNERHDYDMRRADKELRPPKTYREEQTRMARTPESRRKDINMAEPLKTAITTKALPQKFEQMNNTTRQNVSKQGSDVHKFRDDRSKWESAPAATNTAAPTTTGKPPKDVKQPTGTKAPKDVTAPPTERKKPVTPPADHKEPVTPPTERKGPVTPPTDRKGPVTPPADHKEPVTPTKERKGPATPPANHKEPVTPPTDRKGPVTPPANHKEPVTPTTERKGPVTPPVETKGPTEHIDSKTTAAPPREVRVTKPERVKVPPTTVVGKPESGSVDKTPPRRPVEEQKDAVKDSRDDAKDKRDDAKDKRDDSKDKSKDQGKDNRGKDKSTTDGER
jgi:hypothetical protein